MIGVFDSGFGGLTVLRDLVKALPQNDFVYLGDNARAPYGGRSFETIHQYTLQAVDFLFAQGSQLVILACNTASARALRTIQQIDLPKRDPNRRVLGVIRPIVETIGEITKTGSVGILGTQGTVRSLSYPLELAKFWPNLKVAQQACPLWVPLVESGETDNPGASFFIQRDLENLLNRDRAMDVIVLGCTHYPLLLPQIQAALPAGVSIVEQGPVVAKATVDYLHRHPELSAKLGHQGSVRFLTTDTIEDFELGASRFYGSPVNAQRAILS